MSVMVMEPTRSIMKVTLMADLCVPEFSKWCWRNRSGSKAMGLKNNQDIDTPLTGVETCVESDDDPQSIGGPTTGSGEDVNGHLDCGPCCSSSSSLPFEVGLGLVLLLNELEFVNDGERAGWGSPLQRRQRRGGDDTLPIPHPCICMDSSCLLIANGGCSSHPKSWVLTSIPCSSSVKCPNSSPSSPSSPPLHPHPDRYQ